MSSKFELFLQVKANLGSHLPVVMLKSRDVSSILNVEIASGKKTHCNQGVCQNNYVHTHSVVHVHGY